VRSVAVPYGVNLDYNIIFGGMDVKFLRVSDRRPYFPRILRDDFRGAQDWCSCNKNARGGVRLPLNL